MSDDSVEIRDIGTEEAIEGETEAVLSDGATSSTISLVKGDSETHLKSRCANLLRK
jgi:hypothetical protein